MSFDPAWEAWYEKNGHVSGWYPALLFIVKAFVSEAEKVLELGCGSGGNVAMLENRGMVYYGVDGSSTIIADLAKRLPHLEERLAVEDFTERQPFGEDFDLVVDRAAITHNDIAGIRGALKVAYGALKPGGLLICCDWFSTWHSEFVRGKHIDSGTRTGYEDGQFRDVGTVHFSDEAELAELFREWDPIHMAERCERRPASNALVGTQVDFPFISRAFAGKDYRSVMWDLVLRKPK